MTLLVLTGFPSCGKSTAANSLKANNIPVVSMGGSLRAAYPDKDEDEVWAEAQRLREEHGPHGVAVPCLEPIRTHFDAGQDIVVLEGSRNVAETEYLIDELGCEAFVVWIAAMKEDRVDWFSAREGRGNTFETRADAAEKLDERTNRERKAGMQAYFSNADRIVTNYGTQDELAGKIFEIVETIRTRPVTRT